MSLLQMSISAAALILIVVAIRALAINRLPKKTFLALWGVVRRFGKITKSAYALTLIGMEEQKGGLLPLCNSFSKHAIEERVTAMTNAI